MKSVKATTDWLASEPVFYNEKTGAVSNNINEVINFNYFDWHPEGLKNYLDFGYSVFQYTPLKYVRFLPPNSSVCYENEGLKVVTGKDRVEERFGKKVSESEIFDRIKTSINEWLKNNQGDVLVPTSGGYDSRLINFLIEDKSRIRSFTYGLSSSQKDSSEVQIAKRISSKMNIEWESIRLGKFHKYLPEWLALYGVSTHAHGMYHLEFYRKILDKMKRPQNLISGLIGDAWAGGAKVSLVKSPGDLINISYNHGIKSNSKFSILNSSSEIKEMYFEQNKEKLSDPLFSIVEAMRCKIILLSYLIKVPESLGFNVFAPFIEEEVAFAMLNLPSERRKNRVWQQEYFVKNNIHCGENFNIINSLNYHALIGVPLIPLNPDILREIIVPQYVREVNKNIDINMLLKVRSFLWNNLANKRFVWHLFKKRPYSKAIQAYNAYLTLYPLQKVIEKRDEYFTNSR